LETAKNGHLQLNGVDLVDLCDEYGTPLFVFDEKRLRENYRRFSGAFARHYPKVAVCYSIKTNNNLGLCRIMREEGAFAEVASLLDLHVAMKAGFPPERIVLDGLYKPEGLLREALRRNLLLINTESFSELELLNRLAGEMGCRPTVGLRLSIYVRKFLNPEELYCNPLSRFGFPFEDGLKVFEKARKLENLDVCGLMIHPYWGIHQFLPLVDQIQKGLDVKIDFINFGGGFEKASGKIGFPDLVKDAIRQRLGMKSNLDLPPRKVREIEEAGRLVAAEVERTLGNKDSTLVFEPGRYLVHDAGFLMLKTCLVKEAAGYKWIVADGGTNLVEDYLERREIRVVNRADAQREELVNIVGPLLFARDFVTLKQYLPKIQEGDYLILPNAGAYTLSNSTQFLNPRPAAVLVGPDGDVSIVRERETSEDVVRMDRI